MKKFAILSAVVLVAALVWGVTGFGDPSHVASLFVRNALVSYGTTTISGTLALTGNIASSGTTVYSAQDVAIDDTVSTAFTGTHIKFYGDSTGILQFPTGTEGQILYITMNDTSKVTFVDGENLALSGNATVDSTDALVLMYVDSKWIEVVHTAN